MSSVGRVHQWNTFARIWHLYDAKWQNPIESAAVIAKYLQGLHKPIYHPLNDCGDHVIIMNSRHIAFPGYEWKKRVYFHHTGYPKGVSWTLAWQVHEVNPTMVMRRAIKAALPKSLQKFRLQARCHIFPDDIIPEELLGNVSAQIRQIRPVPITLDSYTPKERDEFPKVLDYPKDYILK